MGVETLVLFSLFFSFELEQLLLNADVGVLCIVFPIFWYYPRSAMEGASEDYFHGSRSEQSTALSDQLIFLHHDKKLAPGRGPAAGDSDEHDQTGHRVVLCTATTSAVGTTEWKQRLECKSNRS